MSKAYLTEDEYKAITGNDIPDGFGKLLSRASAELDSVTRFFYENNSLDEDFEPRKRAFKRAVALQIEFMTDKPTPTVEALNGQPDSVTIGDTTVSYSGNKNRATGIQKRTSAVSDDALNALSFTGLLYRGVHYV
ncbi:hypothetical protein NHG29_01845 [Aerococcaceae bacterium NML160702]|nr:hypothetical protein [Aerococcaceae bacterium NML160702]